MGMTKCSSLVAAAVAALGISTLAAQDLTLRDGETTPEPTWLAIPYVFSSETWDFAGGIAGAGIGWPDDYAASFAAATVSANDSWNVIIGGLSYPSYIDDRLSFDFFATFADYTNLQVFAPGNPAFIGDPNPAGTHYSDPDNFFREKTHEEWVEFQFRYLLPWGHAAESPFNTYYLNGGILSDGATGGETWNPLESGRSTIMVRPQYRSQDINNPTLNHSITTETINIQLGFEYDNRDYKNNPSTGSFQYLAVTRDWGATHASDAWTFGEFEFRKYFNLGTTDWARQQVLSLTMWTGHSFTWDEIPVTDNVNVTTNRPPYFTGATLGGLMRMRGYATNRFHDRSVMYYSAEYRVIPEWNPFQYGDIDETLGIDWWQLAAFVEFGRVADTYDLATLHRDMHYDVGIDIRVMVRKAIGRLGIAVSDETVQVVAMFGHPF